MTTHRMLANRRTPCTERLEWHVVYDLGARAYRAQIRCLCKAESRTSRRVFDKVRDAERQAQAMLARHAGEAK